jgi:crossover junction endodeoxyribonuclease RuvC
MLILGVDPGTRHLGWGVVDVTGTRLTHVAHGVIHTDEKAHLGARLLHIDDALRVVIETHRPREAGVEAIFFAKDASAAAKLGHARGVVLLALQRAGVGIFEYPPASVKRAVAGRGRAEKSQVALMVRAILRLNELPRADAADALAIAICHVHAAPARRIAALAKLTVARVPSPAMRTLAAAGRR